jgi:hypothetical protein
MSLSMQTKRTGSISLQKRTVAKLTPFQMTAIKGGNNNSSYPCQAGQQVGAAAASSGICIGTAAIYGAATLSFIVVSTFIPDDR